MVFCSCSYSDKEFNLTSYETKILTAFRKGDTLYFDGSDNKTDTIVIMGLDTFQKKEPGWLMAMPAHNDIGVGIKWFPGGRIHGIFYDSVTKRADTEYDNLITISRYPQQHKVEYWFSYKSFSTGTQAGLGRRHSDTMLINGFPLTHYYIIGDDTTTNIPDSAMRRLFWSEDEGLEIGRAHV